ncbi:DUF1776-domain-containing protein [Aulographum hederae CBS 113979]|uniref:DUF1776-domain-containing protein n=1 Tax=Aulographum hederae CBS 113979 TaxID=1176131 RepID=A0A6G1HGG3_9PEZI|nr:DUF1776-domain-containing protein [Aulographum hederae CBS 113979]
MSSDDQHFLDYLSALPNTLVSFTSTLADATDRHIDSVATSIRSTLSHSTWLPSSARPSPPPPPPVHLAHVPKGVIASTLGWADRHRAVTAGLVAFFVVGGWAGWREYAGKGRRGKRRARRAANGARTEVVVVAGRVGSAMVKSVALDLERRGFIVYIVVDSVEEEAVVKDVVSRPDVRALFLEVGDAASMQASLTRFHNILSNPHHAFPGASSHTLRLTALLVIPSPTFPSTTSTSSLPTPVISDALNAKVLAPIATIQAFTPLLLEARARLLVLSPSIISSLRPAGHALEATVGGATQGFVASLARELGPRGVHVCEFRLGTFDQGSLRGRAMPEDYEYGQSNPQRALGTWTLANGKALVEKKLKRVKGKGSAARELHHAVFDALTVRRPARVWHVGRGSMVYDVLGGWMPEGLVGWMMGAGKVGEMGDEETAGGGGLEDSLYWEKV